MMVIFVFQIFSVIFTDVEYSPFTLGLAFFAKK